MEKKRVRIDAQVSADATVYGRNREELREVATTVFKQAMAKATLPTEVLDARVYILDGDDEQLTIPGL